MSTIEMKPVESSNVKAVGYDAETKALHVEFRNGGKYEYSGVSPEEHQALVSAPSVGSHLHAHIKGRHTARRL